MNEYELWFEKVSESYRSAPRWYRRRLGVKAWGAMLALGLLVIPTVTAWAWTNYVSGQAFYAGRVPFQEVPEETTLDMSAENPLCLVLDKTGTSIWVADVLWDNSTNILSCDFTSYAIAVGGVNETVDLFMALDPVNEQPDVAISADFDTFDPDMEACWIVSENGPVIVPAGIGQVGTSLKLLLTGDPVKTLSCAGTLLNFTTAVTVVESP